MGSLCVVWVRDMCEEVWKLWGRRVSGETAEKWGVRVVWGGRY